MNDIKEILEGLSGEDPEKMEYSVWLYNGIDRGWITPPFCNTHEGDPYMSEEEDLEWEQGGDPCQVVVRIQIGQ
jgi:hypothetical protein